jgi:DNA polymerase-3 subunit delta'
VDDIVGQSRAVSLLRQAASGDLVSHAYLFVGSGGVGKKTAARAFACAILCDDDGCGGCDACSRVLRGAHPDVHLIEPEGAASYVVSQVRELIHDIAMTPVEGPRKVYVLSRAESFNAEAANALLKSLEEPPEDVVMVLLARSADSVLPTISSRCQIVRFERIPRDAAVGLIVERTAAPEDTAVAALAAAGGVLPRAVEMVRSSERMAARDRIVGTLKDLRVMDGGDVLAAAKALMLAVRAPLDDIRQRQEAEIERRRELLGPGVGSTKKLEERHKRELTAREREGLLEILNVTESWLRDCLSLSVGAANLIDNRDQQDAMSEIASSLQPSDATTALAAVGAARRRISYNVSPQLALEAMLFDIREVLRCPR